MRRLFVLLVAFGAMFAAAPPAGAAVVTTAPGGFVTGYVPPVVVITEGEGITYTNADIARHNVVASDAFVPKKAAKKVQWCSGFDAGKCPLFWSEAISAGDSTEVLGLERVVAGEDYGFLCTLHPNMRGTLVVR